MINKTILGFAALSLVTSGSAFGFETSEPILCASVDVYECVDGGTCTKVIPEAVNAPTFFRLDLKKETVQVTKAGGPNKATTFKHLEGRYVMQGVDEGQLRESDGIAWSIQVEEDTARFVATSITRQATITIFGACTEH